MLLPNADPTHGVTNPSARACIGARTTAAAEARISDLITRFMKLLLRRRQLQATYPVHTDEVVSRAAAGRRAVRPRATRRTRTPTARPERWTGAPPRPHTAAIDRRSTETPRARGRCR